MKRQAKPAQAPEKQKPAPDKLDLNTATMEQMKSLKGIGRGRAEEIVRWRDKHPFENVDDLAKVPHVGDMPFGELAEVKAHFVVRLASEAAPPIAPEPEKVDVNTANVGELRSVDGIGLERAEEIVKYREEHGKIRDLNELDELPHFKDEPEGQRAPIKARLRV